MSTQEQEDVAILEKEKIKEPSEYNVIVHNNDITSYDEVIFVVTRCFEKSEEEALQIAHKVNFEGKGICGTYSKEIADSKLELTDMAKSYLVQCMPWRAKEIKALKFTVEEV